MIKVNQVEKNVKRLVQNHDEANFIYDLLLAYGRPKATINRLKNGNLNLSSTPGEVSWKKQLFFKVEKETDLHQTISLISKQIKDNQRFIIVTDFKTFLVSDTKAKESLDINFEDFAMHYDFFLPWAGIEKQTYEDENIADIKAAENMAKLFDIIKKDNPDESPEFIHALNVFLSRLLFCFFAEDTNIFTKNQFTSNLSSHTQPDGSDLQSYLEKVFKILDTPEEDRQNLPDYLKTFPYVNGELFSKEYQLPIFKAKTRQVIIDSGKLDWSGINPDIFGSMLQAVADKNKRKTLAIHYTSVPNIMKVIRSLFLNDLDEEFDKSIGNNKKLIKLAIRLSKIKIFDPACGSGNFLIIAFKELKRLEMKIFKELNSFNFSQITPSQFYGIEIDDFSHEIAKLSLWLTEHQMNIEFFKEFNRVNPTLPLSNAGNITCGNATRIDWEKICPNKQDDEIYVLGNPPYSGSRKQEKNHKGDMDFVLQHIEGYKKLDYVACWFYLGARYILNTNSRFAFVSTNSISQGEQVAIIWPHILNNNFEIFFAYQSFKWTNRAKKNAGITVVIIGIKAKGRDIKKIIKDDVVHQVKEINPYLVPGKVRYIEKQMVPISPIPHMIYGNEPRENGNLLMSLYEKNNLISNYPDSINLIKKVTGANEYINNIERYCLWGKDLKNSNIPEIVNRLGKVKKYRLTSKRKATREYSKYPYLFTSITYENKPAIVAPIVSSERREYVPFGYVDKETVVLNSAQVVYSDNPWIFSLMISLMHMTWMRSVAGRLENRYRYSSVLVYNTFPFPKISDKKKDELTSSALRIISERENYPEKTLAQLYDPYKMPDNLREAHHQNNLVIERCYRDKPFKDDDDRLEYLFNLYEAIIGKKRVK